MRMPPPIGTGEPSKPQNGDDRRGQADHPAFARSSLAAQHLLHKSLAPRHLVEALLIGSDAPYFFIGQRFGLKARCLLPGVELVDFSLEAGHVARGAFVDVAIRGVEKMLRAHPRRALE